MRWLKNNPLPGTVLLLAAAVLAAEGWWLPHAWQQARRGLAKLELKKQERDRLARQSPAPSKDCELAIGRALAGAEQELAALQAVFQGSGLEILAAPGPAKAIDAYVDIAAFVERTRALAANAQVTTRPEERFGFSSYANQGPADDVAPAVFRQRLVLQYLVETLLEARPRALLAVQRERPLTAAQRLRRRQPVPGGREGARQAVTGGQPEDFFDFDDKASLRVPGQMDTEAFRLEFLGQTATVRNFLNSLASFSLPVIVRNLEAEPLSGERHPAVAALSPATDESVKVVAPAESRFTVVVEFVELTAGSGRSAP